MSVVRGGVCFGILTEALHIVYDFPVQYATMFITYRALRFILQCTIQNNRMRREAILTLALYYTSLCANQGCIKHVTRCRYAFQ